MNYKIQYVFFYVHWCILSNTKIQGFVIFTKKMEIKLNSISILAFPDLDTF